MTAEDLRRLPPEERLERALERAREAGALPPGIDQGDARTLVDLFTLHLRAMLRHRPGPYDGRVAFFRAAERRPVDPPHPELGWIDLATSGIEVHVVPGDHGTMYQPPHVDVLARRLARCVDGTGREDR
jgi:thioesterase domain-containing protein